MILTSSNTQFGYLHHQFIHPYKSHMQFQWLIPMKSLTMRSKSDDYRNSVFQGFKVFSSPPLDTTSAHLAVTFGKSSVFGQVNSIKALSLRHEFGTTFDRGSVRFRFRSGWFYANVKTVVFLRISRQFLMVPFVS